MAKLIDQEPKYEGEKKFGMPFQRIFLLTGLFITLEV